MTTSKLILDCIYDHEASGRRNEVFLVQPIGGGELASYT